MDKQGAFDVQVRGKFVFLVMIPIGLTAFRGFEIFSQTFIREYFRLSDRIKHSVFFLGFCSNLVDLLHYKLF